MPICCREQTGKLFRFLGSPRRTVTLVPLDAGRPAIQSRPPAATNALCSYDQYRVSGRLQLSGDRYETDWNIYPVAVILTLGLAELINFPYTVADLTVKSLKRYDLRVGYNCADAFVGYERRRVGDGVPARFVPAPGTLPLFAQQAEPADRLQFSICSARLLSKCSAYFGGGALVESPLFPSPEARLSSVIAMMDQNGESYAYRPGYITGSAHTVLLRLQVEVKNFSDTEQDFRPLDIGISGAQAVLAGLGAGPIPFAKEKPGWEKVRNQSPDRIAVGKNRLYTYVFRVPERSSSWRLAYQGRQIYELQTNTARSGEGN